MPKKKVIKNLVLTKIMMKKTGVGKTKNNKTHFGTLTRKMKTFKNTLKKLLR